MPLRYVLFGFVTEIHIVETCVTEIIDEIPVTEKFAIDKNIGEIHSTEMPVVGVFVIEIRFTEIRFAEIHVIEIRVTYL